ncbi:MAG: TM2 domain-containing protein [Sphingomonadales bacterium]|nr:TM2 domain-containing protein [Sphingomonadales bacterium]
MRGQVLGVDRTTGDGQIAGDDGRRYRFRPEDWSDKLGPSVGATVDFDTNDTRALSIYHVPGSVPAHVVQAAATGDRSGRRRTSRSKIAAALLAFFIGTLGVHRFYLGRTGSGILMLVLTCTIVGLLITAPWALIDFVRYLIMDDGEFDARYNRDY